jgi:hypothetical protein
MDRIGAEDALRINDVDASCSRRGVAGIALTEEEP